MKLCRIIPIAFLLIACNAPSIRPTPTVTRPAELPNAVRIVDLRPTPTPETFVDGIRVYLPVVEAAPTPDARQLYRQTMLAWLQDTKAWADELGTAFASLAPSAPEWPSTLTVFEQRLLALAMRLDAIQPPSSYGNAHEMMRVSMDACSDAITHYKNAKFGFGDLSLSVCTSGIILATSRLP